MTLKFDGAFDGKVTIQKGQGISQAIAAELGLSEQDCKKLGSIWHEIIAIAEKIKTFEISIRPFIDCCTIFNPVAPVTKPRAHIAREMEEKFDYDQLVYECVSNIETITIDANVKEESEIDIFF